MELVLGVLAQPPHVFWQMTMREYERVVQGWRKANGIDQDKGMGSDRLAELMAQYPD